MKVIQKLLGHSISIFPVSVHQVTRKLLLKSLAALKSATKAGTSEMSATERPEGMVKALMEMALFCDRALRAKEDKDSTPLDTEVRTPSSRILYLDFMFREF